MKCKKNLDACVEEKLRAHTEREVRWQIQFDSLLILTGFFEVFTVATEHFIACAFVDINVNYACSKFTTVRQVMSTCNDYTL